MPLKTDGMLFLEARVRDLPIRPEAVLEGLAQRA
jgi:hypothetical protein